MTASEHSNSSDLMYSVSTPITYSTLGSPLISNDGKSKYCADVESSQENMFKQPNLIKRIGVPTFNNRFLSLMFQTAADKLEFQTMSLESRRWESLNRSIAVQCCKQSIQKMEYRLLRTDCGGLFLFSLRKLFEIHFLLCLASRKRST